MNRLLRGVGALGLAAAAGLAIAALSQVPLGAEQRDGVLHLLAPGAPGEAQHAVTLLRP